MSLAFRDQNDEMRFLSKIEKCMDGCWSWKAARFSKGYGQFTLGEFNHRAHRVSHWNFNGEFDETLDVMHSCDNPWCVNPEHLSHGTNQDNRTDSVDKKRHNIGSKNGNSVVTEQTVHIIRQMAQAEMKQAEIARILNLKPMMISRIIRREIWKHVN